MAFLVEVSVMASAASLSCLPPLCPLVAAAAGGAQSVELGQRVGSAACPWPLAAGVTLVPTCFSCPSLCQLSLFHHGSSKAEESETAEGWEAQQSGRATCAMCPVAQGREPRGALQPLLPLGSAAWDSACALCCWWDPAQHGAEVLPDGHPCHCSVCFSSWPALT